MTPARLWSARFLAAALAAAAASPLPAQSCAHAPGTPGRFRPQREIEEQAFKNRDLPHAQRVPLFRTLSHDLWRWVCDHQVALSRDPQGNARLLIEGMVFFDLAEEPDNFLIWYAAAKLEISALSQQNRPLPSFWNRPVDSHLKIARDRLGAGQQTAENWYFKIGKPA